MWQVEREQTSISSGFTREGSPRKAGSDDPAMGALPGSAQQGAVCLQRPVHQGQGRRDAAFHITEVEAIAHRVQSLRRAGWARVRVVTDHGWLLVPGGLPKATIAVIEGRVGGGGSESGGGSEGATGGVGAGREPGAHR